MRLNTNTKTKVIVLMLQNILNAVIKILYISSFLKLDFINFLFSTQFDVDVSSS